MGAMDWGFGGDADAIDVTPNKPLTLWGLTVGAREGDGYTAAIKVFDKEFGAVIYDGYDIYDDSDPIPYGAAVEQWCDLRLKQPVMLEAGKRYELVVTCSEKGNTGGDEHGAFFGEEGAETVECGDGLTLRFHGSERDENDTEDTRGQIAHLIYSLA